MRSAASLIVTAPLAALAGRTAARGDTACNYGVLMVRRVGGGSFGGALVFPGGVQEEQDKGPGDPHVACAIRETYEETGLLLLAAEPPALRARADASFRDLSTMHSTSFRDFCFNNGASALRTHMLARWTTPRAQHKRFDTRFLMLNIGDDDKFALSQLGQEQVQAGELAELDWIAPDQALRDNRTTLALLPPQAYMLHELSQFRRWQDLARRAELLDRSATDRPMEPVLSRRSDGRIVALFPGDRAYPDMQENELPCDTDLFCREPHAPGLHRMEMDPAPVGGFLATNLIRTVAYGQPRL
ncbi:hypothetical protein GGH12_003076 [Coemansia sp. RSA 1822]|nr:hypothetical protein IW147_003678 [Coemansia sp. RSA 720]KAJ2562624.1 hypothetical protein GGH12_003076 [Coemansia sp. RSA 1822]